jgi:Gram-negative porin
MKKSLIAAAVAGMFVAPAAMAEVTISGAIATGIIFGSSDDGTVGAPGYVAGNGLTKESLTANYSNINIGSVDDIGNGLKVMFNYQLVVDVTSTSGNPVNRNSYLGIGGNWGNLKYGTNENVYERMMYSSDFIDGALGPGGNLMILGNPGVGTAFDTGHANCTPGATAGCAGFYRRTDQTIWYESPAMGPFSFEVDYTTSAYKTQNTNPQVLSVGGRFQPEGGMFFIDAAYETHSDFGGIEQIAASKGAGAGNTSSTDDTGMQVGGGITLGAFQVNLRYEILTYEGNASGAGDLTEYERDAMWAGVKWNLPSGYAAAQFGMANEADCTAVGGGCTAPDTGATHMAVAYMHNLSKQSQLQFIYNMTDNDDNASYLAAGGTNVVNGADHSGLYVGIKHTF